MSPVRMAVGWLRLAPQCLEVCQSVMAIAEHQVALGICLTSKAVHRWLVGTPRLTPDRRAHPDLVARRLQAPIGGFHGPAGMSRPTSDPHNGL